MRHHLGVTVCFIVGICLLAASCNQNRRFNVEIENIPNSYEAVGLYVIDSCYNSLRELGYERVQNSRLKFSGKLDNVAIGCLRVVGDSINYLFVMDSVATTMEFPKEGNIMSIKRGSRENIRLQNMRLAIRNLIGRHNDQIKYYKLIATDSTRIDRQESIIKNLDSIDNEIYRQLIEYFKPCDRDDNGNYTFDSLPQSPYRKIAYSTYKGLIDSIDTN